MAVPDSVSVWRQVKQAVVTSRVFESADKIDVPVSGGCETEDGVVGAHPVLRGSRTMPDQYTPFQWPVVSELQQLTTKHGLESPAIANMLRFLTAEEITPFDIKQLAKYIYTQSNTWYRVHLATQCRGAETMKPKSFIARSTFYGRGSSTPRITTGGRPMAPSTVTSIGAGTSKGLGDASPVQTGKHG